MERTEKTLCNLKFFFKIIEKDVLCQEFRNYVPWAKLGPLSKFINKAICYILSVAAFNATTAEWSSQDRLYDLQSPKYLPGSL